MSDPHFKTAINLTLEKIATLSERLHTDYDKEYDSIILVRRSEKHASGFPQITVIGINNLEAEIIGTCFDVVQFYPSFVKKNRLNLPVATDFINVGCRYFSPGCKFKAMHNGGTCSITIETV